MNTRDYKGKFLTCTLTEISKGIAIEFTKNAKTYKVSVEQNSKGNTSMTDYYKFGDLLTHNEFKELENLINRVEDLVSKNVF